MRDARQTQRSRDDEMGDSGIEENTTEEPETNNDPSKKNQSKKSAKERFQELSGRYQKLIEQSSRYRRKGSKGPMQVGAIKPSPRVPPRPLNRDKAGEGKGHDDSDDDGPRITVMIKDKSKSNGKTRIQLPSVGAHVPAICTEDLAIGIPVTTGLTITLSLILTN